jgi:alkaline phosphatase
MKTILEIFKDNDKSTGLVTSASYLDATPAAFGGHADNRYNFNSIIGTMFGAVRPNLILGGYNQSWIHGLGYTVLSNRTEMDDYLALEKDNDPNDKHVLGAMAIPDIGMWGQAYKRDSWGPWFYATYPDLSEMSEFALDILEEDADGFFLMIEAGLIDLAAHENNADLEIGETLEFDQTVQLVVDWYNALGEEDKADTLIIVTADHETGGLDVDCSEEECPSFSYTVDSHSTRWVPVYAIGYNADAVEKITHQFQLFKIMTAEMVVD